MSAVLSARLTLLLLEREMTFEFFPVEGKAKVLTRKDKRTREGEIIVGSRAWSHPLAQSRLYTAGVNTLLAR
jgi:hypothetical protein